MRSANLKLLITTISVMFSLHLSAQLKTAYDTTAVYFRANKLIQNEQAYSVRKFKPELMKYYDSAFELHKYTVRQRRANQLYGGALLMAISAIAVHESPISEGLSFVSGFALGSGIAFNLHARKHLQKSVWYYNRDKLGYR